MKVIESIIRLTTVLAFVMMAAFGAPSTAPAQAAGTTIEVVTGAAPATTCADKQIAVRVTDVEDLTAYHLEISYDPDVIQIVDVVNGGFLGEPENDEFYEPTNAWGAGKITFGMAQQNTLQDPLQPRDGSGDLILITLRALTPNSSTNITIDADNSALVNWPDAMPIGFSAVNGTLATQSCPPAAQDQSVTTAEDTPLVITLAASDPDSDDLTFDYTKPANGTVTGDGPTVTYAPNENYHGADSFTFTATDEHGEVSNTATVSITVTSVLDPPALSSADLAGPYMVGLNQEFHITLTNPTYGDDFSSVLVKFRLEGITTDDFAIEYLETALEPDQWLPLPVTKDGEDVIGAFGPPGGFAVPSGYEDTSSLRVTFNTAGAYPITLSLYDLTPEPDELLTVLTDDVVVVDDLEVTNVSLLRSVDQVNWFPVPGSFAADFALPLDTAEDWHYLDVDTLEVSPRALSDGSHPFYFGATPAGFFNYWAGKGVDENATGYQAVLWQIINNQLPLFYLKVAGTDYTLVDGFTFAMSGTEEPLRLEGSYLPGEYAFTGAVQDDLGFSDDVDVAIIFNDIPVADSQTLETDEDTPLAITLTATDLYPGSLAWYIIQGPQHGVLSGEAPNLIYTPNEDWHGTDSFVFSVFDDSLFSEQATVTIQVKSINDAPVLNPIGNKSVNEQVELTFTATASDADPEDVLTFSLAGTVPDGAAIDSATGAFKWTPAEDQGGAGYTFNVCVSDGTEPVCETITVTVNEVNVAPLAVDDNYETDEDVALLVPADKGVLANDVDPDLPANPLSAELVTSVSNGTLDFNSDGSFEYTPNENYLGTDSFTYRVSDSIAWSNVATVTIIVHEQNDPPVAVADEYTTDEDTLLTVAAADGLLANDSDVDGDVLTVVLVTPPASGVLDLELDGSFTYDPALNFNGVVTFTYVADDGIEQSAETTVTITVLAVDDATTALSQSVTTDEDTQVDITLGIIEVDGDPITWTVGDPLFGTLSGAAPDLKYTPHENYNGPDSFTFSVHDGVSESNTATVSITVNSVNDIPVGADDAYAVNEDTVLVTLPAEGVLVNDHDVDLPPQPLAAVLEDNVQHGTLSLYSDGTFRYTPDADFNGTDSFTYLVYDGEDYSLPVTVTITVNPVEDQIRAENDFYTTQEDATLIVPAPGVLANDYDPDGGDINAMLVGGPMTGTLDFHTDGSFTYAPPANYFGSASFTYLATDGYRNSATKTVYITIESVEDVPVLSPIGNKTVDEETLLTFDAEATDDDLNSVLSFSLAGDVPDGAEIDAVTGVFNWTPTEEQGPGSYTFLVAVCDNTPEPLCDSEEITVTVNEVNKPPVANDQSVTTPEDIPVAITLAATDPDGNPLTYMIANPAHGKLSGTPPNLTYTPNADWFGEDSFTYYVWDGQEVSNTATVTITVTNVPDAPVLVPIGPQTATEGILLTFTASATDADPDTTFTFSLEDGPAGEVPAGAEIVASTGEFTWTPGETQGGKDYTFDVCVSDGALSDCETIIVTVIETNTAPIITGQKPLSTPEDTPLQILITDLTIVDPDDTEFTLTVLPGTNYTVVGTTITPALDFHGELTVNVKVSDGELESPVYPLKVVVTPVNDAPVAYDMAVTTDYERPVSITLTMLDVDGDEVTWTIVDGPEHGVLSDAAPMLIYTPDPGFSGSDSFTFKVNDGTVDSNVATVSITVSSEPTIYIYLPMIQR